MVCFIARCLSAGDMAFLAMLTGSPRVRFVCMRYRPLLLCQSKMTKRTGTVDSGVLSLSKQVLRPPSPGGCLLTP